MCRELAVKDDVVAVLGLPTQFTSRIIQNVLLGEIRAALNALLNKQPATDRRPIPFTDRRPIPSRPNVGTASWYKKAYGSFSHTWQFYTR